MSSVSSPIGDNFVRHSANPDVFCILGVVGDSLMSILLICIYVTSIHIVTSVPN
jgi:hypothetical protein